MHITSLTSSALSFVATFVLLASPAIASAADAQISNVSMFRLDLIENNKIDASDDWYSVSGGSKILHKTDKTTGEGDKCYLLPPDTGDIDFSEVEIAGPMTSVSGGTRAELLGLLNGWATQEGQRFNATLELLDGNQQTVRTVSYPDSSLMSYQPPSVRAGDDSLLEERFSFKPERVEDAVTDPGGGNDNDNPGKRQSKNVALNAAGSGAEEILVSNNFRFEIDGNSLPVVGVQPGAFRMELKDATMGNRQGNFKEFTVTKPHFDNWRIEKAVADDKMSFRNIIGQFEDVKGRVCSESTVTLHYLNQEGESVRSLRCGGFLPTHYESISLDSRNPGQAAVEVMEFSVAYCTYG